MQSVIISQLVRQKIKDIYVALLSENYFAMEENARAYTDKLFDHIKNTPVQKHRLTINKRWGSYYSTYKANRRTTWYITFDKEDNQEGKLFYIRNIFNNHIRGYTHFIAGRR